MAQTQSSGRPTSDQYYRALQNADAAAKAGDPQALADARELARRYVAAKQAEDAQPAGTMDVEMDDGTIVTDVPIGTTKAQLGAKYAAHLAKTKVATGSASPSDTSGYGDSPLTNFGIGWQGVGEGAAHLAGLPVDLTSMAGNWLIGAYNAAARATGNPQAQTHSINEPVGGSQWIEDKSSQAAKALGYPVYDPSRMNEPQKLGYSIDDYGTQAAALGAGGLASAPARAAEIEAGSVPKLGDAFVRPYMQGGARVLAGDVAGGVGAGTGHYVAQREFPGSPIADTLLTLAGGVGGATGLSASEGAVSGARNAAARMLPGGGVDPNISVDPATFLPTTKPEAAEAARRLQGMAFDPTQAAETINANSGDLLADGLPMPTAGILSGDPGLRSAEMGARTKNPAPFMANDDRLRAAATSRVLSLQDPGADQDAVARAALAARSQALAAPQADANSAAASIDELAEQDAADAAPLAISQGSETRVGASRNLDEALLKGKVQPAQIAKNAAFDALDPQGSQMVNAGPLIALAGKIRTQANALAPMGRQLPGEFMQRLEAIAPDMQPSETGVLGADGKALTAQVNAGGDGTTSLRSLVDIRKYLAPAEDAARKSGNFTLADNIRALRNGVNTTIEETPAAAAANQVYREHFVPVARSGGSTEAFVRDVERDPSRMTTLPSETAQSLLGGPNALAAPENFADLRKVLEHVPAGGNNQAGQRGMAAAADYIRSSFAKCTLNDDGTINYGRAQRWLQNNQAALNGFPESATEISGYVAKARSGQALTKAAKGALAAARGKLADTSDAIDRSAIGTILNAQDPRDVAEQIFSGRYWGAPQELDDINAAIKSDPAAQRGWKAAVADVIANKVTGIAKIDTGSATTGETYRVEVGKLDRLFKDNGDLLAKVFSPEEMSTLRQGHKALSYLSNANAIATAGPNTADKFAAVTKLYELWARGIYGALEGGSMVRKLKLMLSNLPNNRNAIDALVQRAWFDPELAGYLLNKKLPGAEGPTRNVLVSRILAVGTLARGEDR